MMMIRTLLAVAAIAIGASAVVAQQNVIAERQELMKRSGQQARIGTQLVRGEQPFDLAKARTVFETFADKANKLPNLFPENSKTGGDTAAAPAIWQKPDEFRAMVAKFSTDSKEALAQTKDLDSFKAAFANVGRDCGACHETFRIKKS